MTRDDINDIINAICPNDEDYEKPCISPKYLRQELEQLALDQKQWNGEPTTKNDLGVDCISRQAVLNLPRKTLKNYFGEVVREVVYVKDIMDLPSVTPQEPRIITCKECKYYRNKGNEYSYCTKRLNVDSVTDRYREPNFYCADAVLREACVKSLN